jgi:deoxyribose-phosphate aldolase
MEALARYIDQTLLRAEATRRDIEVLCREAREHGFYSVIVHGTRVVEACHFLEGTLVKVGTVVGFPHGANDGDAKRYEAEVAVDNGAQEIDVVVNIGRLKDGDDGVVLREIRDVVEAADERPVKVILEAGLLTREEKVRGCRLVMEAGAHFVKTSTGFLGGVATIDDVRLFRETVGEEFGVKASGGIRDAARAVAMIEAGANRLGTSAGVQIVGAGG